MWDRRRLLWGWWLVVLLGAGAVSTLTLIIEGNAPAPSVVRVVGHESDLWAYTYERIFLQGGDGEWWMSRDGGRTWASASPPEQVSAAEAAETTCTTRACYRLVDGQQIERKGPDSARWRLEYERAEEDAPSPNDWYRSDWEEERSVAATDGHGLDAVAVAAGDEGALVRTADGDWNAVPVGRRWEYRIRWWLVAIGSAAVLLAGLVVDQILRHVLPAGVADAPAPPTPSGRFRAGERGADAHGTDPT